MAQLRILGLVLTTAVLAAACRGEAPPAVPAGRDIVLAPDSAVVRGEVAPSTTLDALLRGSGLTAGAVSAVVEASRDVFDPRRLRAAQPFLVERTLDGNLREFEYEIDADERLRVVPVAPGAEDLRAEIEPIPKTRELAAAAASIDDSTPSLFQAMGAAGESPELAIALAQVFAGEIDFNTEVQPGDSFAVTFERFVREAGPATYGAITAAEFSNAGRQIRAIRFTPPGGEPGYFDEQGRSLRRFFLRSPLKFEPRVTSRYSPRRFHPVLQMTRAHRGVDYGAPSGAPVIAVAGGTVLSATFDNVNGRMVRIRHSSGYVSYYLHLSAFGRGIRSGARVDQGQTIGLVGSTGLATGPHLHYGLQKNGAWVDPLREHRNMPPGDPVPPEATDAFVAVSQQALEALDAAVQSRTVAEPGAQATR